MYRDQNDHDLVIYKVFFKHHKENNNEQDKKNS